jgi:hypothetical protein
MCHESKCRGKLNADLDNIRVCIYRDYGLPEQVLLLQHVHLERFVAAGGNAVRSVVAAHDAERAAL